MHRVGWTIVQSKETIFTWDFRIKIGIINQAHIYLRNIYEGTESGGAKRARKTDQGFLHKQF